MKKRMLLSTVLMTLVLLLAATTATFAWYQASASGEISGGTTNQSITTSGNTYEIGALQVKVAFSNASLDNLGPVGSDGSVQFTTADGGNIKFNNHADQELYDVLGSVEWSLVVTLDEETATKSDLQAYAGTEFTIVIDGTMLKLADSAPADGYVANDSTLSYTVKIAADGSLTGTTSGKVYVSVHEEYSTKNGSLTVVATVAEKQ